VYSILKIYTKTGDKGHTGLIDGSRALKSDLRIIAYGEVDEANSHIGLIISKINGISKFEDLEKILVEIQNDLFVLGAELANPKNVKDDKMLVKIGMVTNLENQIDKLESELEPITYFILPGGTTESSLLHICRTVIRRAERSAVALSNQQKINQNILIYLNRLSDLLFVLARVINMRQNCNDVAWKLK
jgi:cob(I)alamin adenosyltransferase